MVTPWSGACELRDLAFVKAFAEGHDEKTGMSLDEMTRKGRIVLVTHAHLYNRQQRMNSWRLSNT